MKKFILGLTCGIALSATTAVYASDSIQAVRQVFINGNLLNTNVQVSEDGTTMISARTLAEALGAKVNWNEQANTVEIANQYPYFVASLLHGKYSFKYEIITDNKTSIPNTTVVYSEGYKDIPDNTDYQKLFLLLLVDQLDENIKTKQIEFWSNEENAHAYVSGQYEKGGIEGWSGMNSRFGLLIRDGEKVSLSHFLSVHERDVISFGKYNENLVDVGSGLKAEELQTPSQNGPKADTVGSATVETVGKDTKVSFVYKNQSDKTITVQGGARYTLQKDNEVIETGGVPVKDYIDLEPGQEYKDKKIFTNLKPGSYRREFVWNNATTSTEFILN